jgi:hypothetical protein
VEQKANTFIFLFGGLDSRFLLGMKCSFPAKRKGLTKMESEKFGLGSRPLLKKLFFWNVVFTEWKEMC